MEEQGGGADVVRPFFAQHLVVQLLMRRLTREGLSELRANPRFLVAELLARGIAVSEVDAGRELFLVEDNGSQKWLLGIEHEALTWVARELVHDKHLTRHVLEAGGVPTPPGQRFVFSAIDVGLVYARHIGFPVVVKAVDSGRGENVHVGLTSMGAVEAAAELVTERRPDTQFIVEKQVSGVELRVFMTRTGRFAAVRRTPASVVGDGKSSIAELAARETERRMNPRVNCLGPLLIDAPVERWLARSGQNRFTIPYPGLEVPLLGHVDALGAYSVDVTDDIHPSLAALCLRTVLLFSGVEYLGIDLVCAAPNAPAAPGSTWILEVNNQPALGLHMAPAEGAGHDVAAAVADSLFAGSRRAETEVDAALRPCRALASDDRGLIH